MRIAVIGGILLAAAMPATAQPVKVGTLGGLAAARERFAACFVKSGRELAIRILEESPGSSGEASRLAPVVYHSCYRRHLSMVLPQPGGARRSDSVAYFQPRSDIRAVLAEALYKADFHPSGEPRSAQLARMPKYEELAAAPTGSALAAGLASAGAFARCIVERDVAGARRLLDSAPRTRGETMALESFAPFLEGCVPAGKDPAVPGPIFRGYVAEALYRHFQLAGSSNGVPSRVKAEVRQ